MSFTLDWLELREPADIRARNIDVLEAVQKKFTSEPNLRITDIACGAGSTLISLHEVLGEATEWTLVDYDEVLLARAAERSRELSAKVKIRQLDLNIHMASVLNEAPHLLTCSAFLDLVSERWLIELVQALKLRKLPLYAALTYDGRASCSPQHPADLDIISAVNRHQRGDKGFGPALGPGAADFMIAQLEQAGFEVVHGRSDWQFEPEEGLVQAMLIEGWANAASEIGGLDPETIDDWRDWRLTRAAAGRSEIRVGHVDVFAVPG